jgi:hypothetical protein
LTASLFGERWGGMANRWRPQNSESNSRSWTRLSPGWKMKLPNKKQRHAAGYEKDAPAGTRQTGCDRWSAEDQRRNSWLASTHKGVSKTEISATGSLRQKPMFCHGPPVMLYSIFPPAPPLLQRSSDGLPVSSKSMPPCEVPMCQT